MNILNRADKPDKGVKQFEKLISPIYKDLYRYIYVMVKNNASAEDILQTTILNAYKSFSNLNDINKFKSWIFTIAKNETFNLFKKYKREITMDISDNLLPESDEQYLPEDFVMTNEIRYAVISAINELQPVDRDIIILKYYAGLQLQEIAELLNMNPNTIRTRHRAIKGKIYNYLVRNELIEDYADKNVRVGL